MAYKAEHDLNHHYMGKKPQKMSMKIVALTAVDWSALEGHLLGIVDGDIEKDERVKAWAERVLSAIKEPITGEPINVPD